MVNHNSALQKRGATSNVCILPHIFIKYIVHHKEHDVYVREKYMSSILSQFNWYPRLLYSDDVNQILIFENVGEPISKKNKPRDFVEQMNTILTDIKSVNVDHNDIKPGEILVNSKGKVFLCDFGWASVNDYLHCDIGIWGGHKETKPGGLYHDTKVFSRLKDIM